MRLAFITPVHERVDLSLICMEQRYRLCSELRLKGIEAIAVYIGDDENIDNAREFGFHTIVRDNTGLGSKFNDGITHAICELGADAVVPIGSDDWALAGYFTANCKGDIRSGGYLAVMRPDGEELVALGHRRDQVLNAQGFIPWVVPDWALEATNYRPVAEKRDSGTDDCMAAGIRRTQPRPTFAPVCFHPLQCVDFKNPTRQITRYDTTVEMNSEHATFSSDAFEQLAEVYPADLCERMEKLYAGIRSDRAA